MAQPTLRPTLLVMLVILALALPTFAAVSSQCTGVRQFDNPLRTDNAADPYITQQEGFYFLTRTTLNATSVVVLRSTLMHEWQNATAIQVYKAPANGTIYAPELHMIGKKLYIYFAGEGIVPHQEAGIRKLFVLEAAWINAQGPYKFLGELKFTDAASDLWASDPTILTIPGHSSVQYLVWSGRDTNDDTTLNIYIAKLANPTTVSGARLEISSADYAWEKIGDAINEAPQVLISPQNEVYIVYSASGAWTADYTLGLLVLSDPLQPLNDSSYYKPSKLPLFATSAADGVHSPGGASFLSSAVVTPASQMSNGTETNREWWMFYSARDTAVVELRTNPVAGRTLRTQPFTWSTDDSPMLGVPAAYKCRAWPSGDGTGLLFQKKIIKST